MSLAAWRQCAALIAKYGADFEEHGHHHQLVANVYTPIGLMWRATDCHTLTVNHLTDRGPTRPARPFGGNHD